MRLSSLAATAFPLFLLACSDGGADADGDGTITGDEMAREMRQGPEVAMEPGRWEQSLSFSELDMPGAPAQLKGVMEQNMGAKVTTDTCLTEDQVGRPDADFFAGKGRDNCEYQEFDRSGNHIKLRMTCEDEGGATNQIAMEGDFSPTAYTFDMAVDVKGGAAGPMSMKGTIAAKRIGECAG